MQTGKGWAPGRGRHGSGEREAEGTVYDVKRSKLRLLALIGLGSVALVFLFILSLTLGTIQMSLEEAMGSTIALIFKFGNPEGLNELVVFYLRMPRAIAAIAVGVGLSTAGVVMQALIRNPLVDPYVTGISSGAGLGAALAGLMGLTLIGSSVFSLPIAAFVGAVLAFFFTMGLAESAGGRPISYVLSGVIVGIMAGAITTLVITFNSDKLHGILFWMFGSFANVGWDIALMITIPVALTCALVLFYARDLNVILLGDEQAKQLGLDTVMLKRCMIAVVSILAGVCVAFTGIIGFVGLIVPHVARILVGGDHRMLLPSSMILGAILLLAADIACKTLASPMELPVGAIISVIGAPFFAYLMIRTGKQYGM